jgi:Lar family restriction alleviation protein
MTSQSTVELKECPFCGGTEICFEYSSPRNQYYYCGRCGVATPGSGSPEQAASIWNRRAHAQVAAGLTDDGLPPLPKPLADVQCKNIERGVVFTYWKSPAVSYFSADHMRAYGLNCKAMAELAYTATIHRLRRELEEVRAIEAKVQADAPVAEQWQPLPAPRSDSLGAEEA